MFGYDEPPSIQPQSPVEPDDDDCATCGGLSHVEVQTDVDETKVYACPDCNDNEPSFDDEPDYDRDDG